MHRSRPSALLSAVPPWLAVLVLTVLCECSPSPGGGDAVALALSAAAPGAVGYAGGFASDGRCVDICSGVAPPTCFGEDPGLSRCRAKRQAPGDWDFLVLEMMFLPQFCRELQRGVDITVTHRSVSAFPEGTQCIPERVTDTMSIHGLWPNYIQGFPACCNNRPGSSPPNAPFDPVAYNSSAAVQDGFVSVGDLDQLWRDPTMADPYQSLCYMLNHEYQKHGVCLGRFSMGDSPEAAASQYFEMALLARDAVSSAVSTLDRWAREGYQPSISEILDCYPERVQIFCSAGDLSQNLLSVVRTCYGRSEGPLSQLDLMGCDEGQMPYGPFRNCTADAPVRLERYRSPLSSAGTIQLLQPVHHVGTASIT